MEKHLMSGTYVYQSDFAKKYFGQGKAEGRAEGRAEGKAEGVLVVLEARSLPVSAEVRARVLECGDVDQLDRWLRRALVVSAAGELFSTP